MHRGMDVPGGKRGHLGGGMGIAWVRSEDDCIALLVARPPPLHVPSILQVLEGPSAQGRCLCGSWWKHLVEGTPRPPPHRNREGFPAASKKYGTALATDTMTAGHGTSGWLR